MKTSWIKTASLLLLAFPLVTSAATLYVDLNSPTPTAPYSGWATAATNIQDAIEAAGAGDLVLVTNGVYATGGKVMAGDLTNRVAIDKAITVQSVNGWAVTQIQGQKDPATNGPVAIRCAWLTNGASLVGFTLRDGATRAAGDQFSLRSGGGIWASSTNAMVSNCLLVENAAHYGGGAYRGWLADCTIKLNFAEGDGGGGYSNVLYRCSVIENWARNFGGGVLGSKASNCIFNSNLAFGGGGAYGAGVLVNCTFTFNKATTGGGTYSSGAGWVHTNCLIWDNQPQNYSGGLFRNCCTSPSIGGIGNISSDPLLFGDGIHISSNSPCRAVGFTVATGTDIDGQAWNSPPAIGCDEWKPEPMVTAPRVYVDSWGTVRLSATPVGQSPFTYRWVKDGGLLADGGNLSGTITSNLIFNSINPTDMGSYQLIVSNTLGAVTSQVAQLTIRFVDVNGLAAAPPYSTWTTAATNIQDAADVAGYGDLILVAGGIYGRGGKVMAGDLTNRVALNKALTLMSVSGPSATVIQGAWDSSSTNGPGAVRGVWMADGAALIGFTVRGGATRGLIGDGVNLQSGGGIWCSSTNARIVNCIIQGNAAGAGGGGGVFRGTLQNCLVKGNTASGHGAGAAYSVMVNCTVVENSGSSVIAVGVYGQSTNRVYNSIVWGNYRPGFSTPLVEYSGVLFTNSCTRPLPSGAGNISADPLLEADGIHLQSGSPCLNAGNSSFATGFDLDGQPWSNPPSMGCDERLLQLAVGQPAIVPTGDGKIRLRVVPVGAGPQNFWWFKDGILLANGGRISGAQSAELVLSAFDPTDAGFYHAVVTNNWGSVTSAVVRLQPHFVDVNGVAPAMPYSTWGSASLTIQDAIEAANFGDLIVVADGNYSSGGKVVSGDLTNRIVLNKAVFVTSLNGPTNAIITGQKDPVGPNGNGNSAVRSVWMETGTSLAGFTIRDGATRTNGDVNLLQSGGGIWAYGPAALVSGCVITTNSAQQNGGGVLGANLERCLVIGNAATNGGGLFGGSATYCYFTQNRAFSSQSFNGGGGAWGATLRNSVVHKNYGDSNGGAIGCNVYNCTVTENQGNGLFFGSVYNTISWGNTVRDYSGSIYMNYSCAKFAVGSAGTNNLFVDPQLVDPFHLSANSPCRGAGGPLFVSGTDWDGDAWGSPVSMGADEFVATAITGPLSVEIELPSTPVYLNRLVPLVGRINGRAARIEWSFGEGTVITNVSYATLNSWANPGEYVITFTAFNASHPEGVSTNGVLQVTAVPAPSWTKIENLGGYYRFTINTQIGVTNTIEFATNLTAPILWMPLQTSVATNVLMREFDFTSTNAARFYRLRAQ